ncbi:MAG: ATP-binding SpoIIE family protein phosphatase [Actinomycetales bacterium]
MPLSPHATARHVPVRVHDLLAETDWSRTPLGERGSWPAGLAAVVETVLASPHASALAIGPARVLVYNDTYARALGSKHPAAFGKPAAVALAENWGLPGHGDVVDRVFATGEPFVDSDTRLPVARGAGRSVEEVRFARAYSPVRDDSGRIIAVLAQIVETTATQTALAGLADLAARLAGALSTDDVAIEALRWATESGGTSTGADHARLVLRDGNALRMARASRVDAAELPDSPSVPAQAGGAVALPTVRRLPPVWVRVPSDAALPGARVVRRGAALWLDEPDLAAFEALEAEPGGSHLQSVASVPAFAGSLLGALSLGYESRRHFTPSERATLLTAGGLVGQALARARRFDEQREHSETLQRSMLPAALPELPGISVAARYEPSAGASAGGDFYDVFERDNGDIVVVIGDVVGHGMLAAAVMGQVRAALRVLALGGAGPSAVLAGLDAFVASLGPEVFVTAVVGLLSADGPGWSLDLASAGHPAPLHRRLTPEAADGAPPVRAAFLDVVPGPPLGVPGDRHQHRHRLAEGDSLLLFTDGLVEVPGEDLGEGLQRLRDLVERQEWLTDPRGLCTGVLGARRPGEDDVAVLAIVLDGGRHRIASIEVPAESRAPGQARRWASDLLRSWGIAAEQREIAVLSISELVTNALIHARSTARLELDLDAERLLVLVSDTGLDGAVEAGQTSATAERGRGLMLVESLSDAWGSERTSRGTTTWFELRR